MASLLNSVRSVNIELLRPGYVLPRELGVDTFQRGSLEPDGVIAYRDLVVAAFLGDDSEREAKKGIYYARFTGKREGDGHSAVYQFTRVTKTAFITIGDRIGVFLTPEERSEEMVHASLLFPFTDDMKALLGDVIKMERLVEDPTKAISKELNEKYEHVLGHLITRILPNCCTLKDQKTNAELFGTTWSGYRDNRKGAKTGCNDCRPTPNTEDED